MFARNGRRYASKAGAQSTADWLNEHGYEPHRSMWFWYPVLMPLGHWELYRVQRSKSGTPGRRRASS